MIEKARHRIAVRAPNWLGDCVMSTPFLFELRTRYPDARIAVLCRSEHAMIFQNHPSVDETLILSANPALDGSFDTGYILPTSFSSAWQFYRAHIPVRIGHAGEGRSFFLTQAIPLDPRFHYVRRYLSLLGCEGLSSSSLRFSFPLTDTGRQEWERLTVSLGIKIRKPMLVIAPGSRAPARRYFPDRFAAVADTFVKSSGGSVVLLGSTGDAVAGRELCERASVNIINLCGQTTLEGFGAVLKESAVLLTNESGAMHVAWALGIPSVVLAGPSDTLLTAPWGEAARILQHEELWCVPCVRNVCPRFGIGYKECLRRIGVEEVWNVLEEALNRPPARSATA